MKHTGLANQVITMLLNGNDEVLLMLMEQYKKSVVVSEEYSEVGFYIDYQIDKELRISDEYHDTFQIGDVDGEVNNIKEAVGFILYVKNSYLTMLEGYTNIIDRWPETDSKIKLKYDMTPRNYKSLQKKWMKK